MKRIVRFQVRLILLLAPLKLKADILESMVNDEPVRK